ncbi:MAG: ATP-binding protein, partial [Natronospirillum sp.]
PLQQDGVHYVLGSSRNINDMKLTEQRLAKARDDSEAANIAKTLFLANMSHELRTPLNGIVGSASLLRRTYREAVDTASQLDLIIHSADAMNRLVEDILDLSKIANNSLRITLAPCQLKSTIRDVATLLGDAAAQKNLVYKVDISPNVPEELIADETRIRQILLNLISNAVKFTDAGTVSLQVDFQPSLDTKSPLAGTLKILVTDTGIGIPADNLEHLGTPFYQVHPERSRQHTGSGIGLSVCRSLVDIMSGSFNLTSTLGQGTTVAVELPLNTAELATPPETADKVVLPVSFRVLVVEDNGANQLILRRMLQYIGVHVSMADDGEMAVAMSSREPFDLVLMDLQMPKMDGISAAHAMREAGLAMPIVAVTASVSAHERAACLRANMNAFIEKPVRLAALEALLVKLFPAAA